MEYLEKFNQLCQYAAERVWDDEEKKRCFMRGLHSEIQRILISVMDNSYDEIVSIAIAADDANQADLEYKKRKHMQEESSGSNVQRLKIVYQPVHRSLSSTSGTKPRNRQLFNLLQILPIQSSRILLVFVPIGHRGIRRPLLRIELLLSWVMSIIHSPK
jgi:hypothetical protein